MDLDKVLGLNHAGPAVELEDQVARICNQLVGEHYYVALNTLHTVLKNAAVMIPAENFMELAFHHFNSVWRSVEEHAGDTMSDFEESGEDDPTPAISRAILAKTSVMLHNVLVAVKDRSKVKTPEEFLIALELLKYEFYDDLGLEFDTLDALEKVLGPGRGK